MTIGSMLFLYDNHQTEKNILQKSKNRKLDSKEYLPKKCI